jgi:hypothetical protein
LAIAENNDAVKIHFTAGATKYDNENKAVVHAIRQCVDDGMLEDGLNEPCLSKNSPSIGGRRIESRWVVLSSFESGFVTARHFTTMNVVNLGLLSRAASKIRLIDVLNRQIIDSTTNERYIARSYVWGSGQQFCLVRTSYSGTRVAPVAHIYYGISPTARLRTHTRQ